VRSWLLRLPLVPEPFPIVLDYPQAGLENRQNLVGIFRVDARGMQLFYSRELVSNDLVRFGDVPVSPLDAS
jgi:hypothetical protein